MAGEPHQAPQHERGRGTDLPTCEQPPVSGQDSAKGLLESHT
jgi:hypothetical protein